MSRTPGPVQQRDPDEDITAIDAAREAWTAAYDAGDADAFVSHMTPDIVLMPHTGDLLANRERVRTAYESYFSGTTADLTISPVEVEVAGDWAFERGTAVSIRNLDAESGRLRQDANYMVIWRHTGEGKWKMARAIFVGDYRPVEAG